MHVEYLSVFCHKIYIHQFNYFNFNTTSILILSDAGIFYHAHVIFDFLTLLYEKYFKINRFIVSVK